MNTQVIKIITLFLVLIQAFPAKVGGQENGEQEILAMKAKADKVFDIDIYAETYRLPFNSKASDFERLRSIYREESMFQESEWFKSNIFFGIENEHLEDFNANLKFQLGLLHEGAGGLSWVGLVERNNLTDSRLGYFQGKLGVYAGNQSKFEDIRFFSEYYFESFFLFPEKTFAFFTFAGSARVGYRIYELNHWIIDPLVLELKGSDSSNKFAYGPDYLMMNIGPRINYWLTKPTLSFSFFASRSFTTSYTKKNSDSNPYWVIFYMGAGF